MHGSAPSRLIEQQLAQHYQPTDDNCREYTAALVWCLDRLKTYATQSDDECLACRVLKEFRQEFLVPAVA